MQLSELLDAIFRWAHLIAGIMWIGNSMLWNWMDRNLEKQASAGRLSQGKIFMVHSGAFYDVEKKLLAPGEMPKNLYWFKWQNGFTWMTGIALMFVVYYMNGASLLVDPAVAAIDPVVAISISLGALFCAWIIYDGLWRTLGESSPTVATGLSIILLFGSIFAYSQVFSGRAAYMQTGVMIGTLMTGNVWMIIMPSQRGLIEATKAGTEQDPMLSIRAKQRSIHNNYFTFPLLFIMVSNHASAATNHPLNWLILILVMIGGAGVRHFMNVRYRGEGVQLPTSQWLAPAFVMAGVGICGLFIVTQMGGKAPPPAAKGHVSSARAHEIVTRRCVPCHAAMPAQWPSAPQGVKFDTQAQMQLLAPNIYEQSVITDRMPLNNVTIMTPEERGELRTWIENGANLD